MQKKKFIIFAPSYAKNVGGAIALHKLCDLLNRAGYEAYLYPLYVSYELHPYNLDEIENYINELNNTFLINKTLSIDKQVNPAELPYIYWVNPNFLTPVFKPSKSDSFGDEWVVIYPEITFGNPLRAKNVVRWFLHNPGFFNSRIYYSSNELYFLYSKAFNDFQFPGSKTSNLMLMILDIPLDLFYEPDISQKRSGTAYLLRKGWDRVLVHNLDNSILIDGKSNSEIADIFRSVETFISYDPATLYSNLAVLCGCNSVVIPFVGVSEENWCPNYMSYGVAYGFDNISKAKKTAPLLRDALLLATSQSHILIESFVSEINEYFK